MFVVHVKLSYSKTGNKKRATCFATLLQNDMNTDVARFTTRIRTCLATNKVARLFFVGGKTSNSHIQLVLQQCCTFLLLLSVLPHLKTVTRLLCKGSGRVGGRNLLAVLFFSFYTQKHCKRLRNLIKLYQVMFEGYRWAERPSLRANSRGGGVEV